MNSRLRKLVLSGLTLLLLPMQNGSVYAAEASSDALWFANLAKTNFGKTYCAPETATINELLQVVAEYVKKHPDLNGNVNAIQAIQALSERYPCNATATPEMLNTPIAKLGARNISIVPTGEYTTIDTKQTAAIMQSLNNKSEDHDELVDQIVKNSGNYMPPIFFSLANLFYKQGKIEDAIFWFNAGRLRSNFDAGICTDTSARSAVAALVMQIPAELRTQQFNDLPKLKSIIERVLEWDKSTPAEYDHRWISLHGVKAIQSATTKDATTESLTVPNNQWQALAEKNRDQYRKGMNDAIEQFQKKQGEL